MAVRPDWQGTGTGTALLEAHHRILDAAGLPAYLEASGPDTRQVYLRRGYADHGRPIRLPDGPLMYPMLRPSRITRAADADVPGRMRTSGRWPGGGEGRKHG